MYPDDTVFEIPVIIEPDEDGFHAYCPDLPGLHVDGDTKEEALQNARDAAKGFLLVKLRYGKPIPPSIVRRKARSATSWPRVQKREEQTVNLALAFA